MKKSILIICMMMATAVTAVAQNKAVNKAERSLKSAQDTTATIDARVQQLNEAMTQINAATQDEKTKDKPKTWYTRGMVYAEIAGATDPAIKALAQNPLKEASASFTKAKEFENNPNGVYTLYVSQALDAMRVDFINKGATAYNEAKFADALLLFDKALTVSPEDTLAGKFAGFAALQTKDYDRSAQYLYKLVETGYVDKDVYNVLVSYESDQKKDYDKALAIVRKGKKAFPDDVNFRKQEVALLLNQDKVGEAKVELQKAIDAEPNNADLYFDLGYLSEELGDQAAAVEAYKKALSINPKHNNSAFNLAVIHFNRALDLEKESKNVGLSKAEEKKGAELRKQAAAEFKVAVPFVEKALELHPDNRTLMEITMVTYDRAGMKDKSAALEKKLDSMPQQ